MPTTFKPQYETLCAVFDASTQKYADRPLFGTKQRGEWQWMTYGQFAREVAEVRAGLASLGVGNGDRVGIIANNRPEWAVGAYATYGLGAAYVPMYESQMPTEWAYILKDCGARAVIVANAKIRDAILAAKAAPDEDGTHLTELEHVIVLDAGAGEKGMGWAALRDAGKKAPAPAITPAPSDVACFIYTSGTTGKPKGVKLTHANFACNVSAMHEVFPMSPEDRSLSFLPWAHSFGQTAELHMLFSMGASMGIAEAVDKILDNLKEVQPTLLFSVPRIFNRLYDRVNKQVSTSPGWRQAIFRSAMKNVVTRKRLAEQRRTSGTADLKQRVFDKLVFQKIRDLFGGRLKYAFSGGAAISREVAEFIDNLGIVVYEGYGLTETSPIATANWPGARKIGSVGKAIPGVTIKIDLTATGDPKNGEIVVYGHNVMQGYHALPEENDKVFTSDGGFRTGDMGYLDEEGFLYITGRIKEQYKLENGKYVAPAPLEELIKLSGFVANAMVYGDNKPYNVALVVANMAEVQKWADAHGVSGSGAALLENDKVQALLREEVDKHSADFKQFEKIKKIKLISEDFTVDNGMLTPKMSLKRRVVMQRYGEALQTLY
ncbi:MAG: long-chain fatty acid--CoA ligase [Sandaracinaceae bacterium]|nr:long-chain fatty acid--CoA ligase [Sandaracinaceae bacterium]